MATMIATDYRWRNIIFVVSVLGLISCVTGPVYVDMRYPEGAVVGTAENLSPSSACDIAVDKVIDARSNKHTLGYMGGTAAVYGEDVESWVRSGLADLRSLGYSLETVDTTLPPAVRMDVSLKQAYVRSVNTSLESNVRLTVRYSYAGGKTTERSYRGGYVKINWAAAADELMGTLNHAMVGAVRDIAKDLPALCGI